MFYKWRINRLKRKIFILDIRLKNLVCSSDYEDEALRVADKLNGYNYDLNVMEGKAND